MKNSTNACRDDVWKVLEINWNKLFIDYYLSAGNSECYLGVVQNFGFPKLPLRGAFATLSRLFMPQKNRHRNLWSCFPVHISFKTNHINTGTQTFRKHFAALSRPSATAAKTHVHICRCHSNTKRFAWVSARLLSGALFQFSQARVSANSSACISSSPRPGSFCISNLGKRDSCLVFVIHQFGETCFLPWGLFWNHLSTCDVIT